MDHYFPADRSNFDSIDCHQDLCCFTTTLGSVCITAIATDFDVTMLIESLRAVHCQSSCQMSAVPLLRRQSVADCHCVDLL